MQVINKRFPDLFRYNIGNKEFILAALSNPAVKGDFIEKDEDFNFCKQLLIEECKLYQPVEPVEEEEEGNPVRDSTFIVSFASRRVRRTTSSENQIEADVARFLADPVTDIKLLERYPTIREVFCRYNTTLSSSAAVERIFSQCLLIVTPRRNRMLAEHFEKTLLLKINRNLLDETSM